ncbi:LolA family protein [Falsiroseomonas sp.]|uniref:LolA family protein n=1 Tax=Falsiroseomonas sp. TaxID=2870721 RepID=UPI003F71BDAC
MQRRTLIAAAALFSAPALAQQSRPAAPPPAPAPAIDRAALARVEAYLNGLRTLKARFLQVAQNGASAEGTALISRPGRMRFDYNPPEPMLLVASGGQVMMYDRDLRQPSTVPASSTPLGLLLRSEIRLSGDITVVGTERSGGFLRVGLHRTGAPQEGRLTLAFQEQPMELRQWVVLDAQGRETRVTLYEVETGVRLDNKLFDFNDPTFMEQEGLRRAG